MIAKESSADKIALTLELRHGVLGILEGFPVDTVLSAECRLMDFSIRRTGGDAAKIHRLYTEGIAGAEHASHII